MSDTVLSPANQRYIESDRVNRGNKNTSIIIKDNNLKQDMFLKKYKKEIIANSALGAITLTFCMSILAHKGKLGPKAQELVNSIINKFDKGFNSGAKIEPSKVIETTKPVDIIPSKPFKGESVVPAEIKPVKTPTVEQVKPTETKVEALVPVDIRPKIEVQDEIKADIIAPLNKDKAGLSIKDNVQDNIISTFENPKLGNNLNLSTTNSSKTINVVMQEEGGEYIKHAITLDESTDLYGGKIKTGMKLYSDYGPTQDAARARTLTSDHELPEDWIEEFDLDYEFADKNKFPTLKSYAEYMSDPKRLQENQLKKLKKCPVTNQEYYLYRGVNFSTMPQQYNEMFQSAKIGDVMIPDYGVSCTTPDPSYAINHYAGGGLKDTALLRIKTPIGSRLAGLEKDGFTEYHMPSMSEYRFAGKHKIGNFTIYDLDYIMPDLSKV